ncbi:conserved hypothetical protein [Imperialibacter sp. EC-SDR9]|nr:conserved hypothetical protein [Imperialibacter sp. 89]CAD5291902.1 conserved hypothetical protein [Imperialibacter sp. 75]VVT02531.1 conserved hypothetical protein [Imperialibacter sp. EC-SDR9]
MNEQAYSSYARVVHPLKIKIMKTITLVGLLLLTYVSGFGQDVPSSDIQMKTALLAAPTELKDGAKIYGYNGAGEFITLREGTNGLICLSDDPNSKGFNVACYQKDLDPFMARGRELKKEGKTSQEIFDIRETETKAGKINIPKGSTLYVYNAEDGDVTWASGEVVNGYLRYVVYVPFETSESTGLPTKPEFAGQPWIMNPGTHRAHIMLSPPRE